MFQDFLKSNRIYSPDDIDNVLDTVMSDIVTVSSNTKYKYYNVACSFDIETSSFYRDTNEKVAIMYVWQFGINGSVIVGRTWEQFITMVEHISNKLGLSKELRLIVYVHNLGYEFQFIRKRFEWEKVFSLDIRKPVYALNKMGIEFRCSYILSGYSLAKLGDELTKYKVNKMIGDLDYNKIRHQQTPLTKKELGYCVNDVKVVMAFIQEEIENNGNISTIPLTNTGYVRKFVRQACFYNGYHRKNSFKRMRYMEIMNSMQLSVPEYKQLKRAFQGGFTHCNPFYSGKLVNDVESFDFTSSYPAVMVAEQFPMSSAEEIQITSKEEFEKNLKLYCCLFDVEIIGLESKLWFESYLSRSRCWGVDKAVLNNGRIVSAAKLYTTLTDQDYMILKKFYSWESLKVGNFRRYKKDYLPTDFVKAILKLYGDKTMLKGVEGKEVEYMKSKGMVNSCYGMAVTDIIRENIRYDDEWMAEQPDIEKAIEKYNKDSNRFLFYPWGVWVTAYARRNLFTGILECGNDYIYSDTDSIKIRNPEKHMAYINKYNQTITNMLYKAMTIHGLPRELVEPRTIKGVKKTLGVWDDEGKYSRFKSLGAKRYMVEKDGKINLTVSGLNKKICIPWMIEKWGNDVFEHFNDGLYVPVGYTGKNTHTYIDDERAGVVVDCYGVLGKYDELSAVHLSASDYSLSIAREYSDYLLDLRGDDY